MLKKNLAAVFAILLGVFGVHRFYLGQTLRGIGQFAGFFFAVFVTAESGGELPLPFIIAAFVIGPIITGILFFAMSEKKFLQKYDPEAYEEMTRPVSLLDAPVRDSKLLRAEGVRYYKSRDYDLAAEAFQEAILVDPTDAGSHFNLACAYAKLNRFSASLEHLERAVTFDLPLPERIEDHPALDELRQRPIFLEFRKNNYRREQYANATNGRPDVSQRRKSSPKSPGTETEELTDFNTPPRPPHTDLLDQINRLRELHDAGILTREEFQHQRERLLG